MIPFIILLSAPETPIEWVSLIAACVVALAIVGYAIYITIKMIKEGKFGQLKDAIIKAIKEAEKTHGSSEDKLKYALAAVKAYCGEIGIKVDDKLLAWVTEYIEKYILDHNELEEIEEQEGK